MEERFDTQRLLTLRKITRVVADHLNRELNAHLSTLAPLVSPRSVFGAHIRSSTKVTVKGADKALEELTKLYETVHQARPFNLRSRFDTPLDILGASPQVSPREYTYSAPSGEGKKHIRITSPLSWILTYNGFGPNHLRELLGKQREAVGSELQQCILHYLVLYVTLTKRPGVIRLLDAIRFPVSFERIEEFGDLPIPIISCPVSTIRPPDPVLVQSTEISGAPQFEEVIDLGHIAALADPFKADLVNLIREHGDEECIARSTVDG